MTGATGWLVVAVPDLMDSGNVASMAAGGLVLGVALAGPTMILGAFLEWRERKAALDSLDQEDESEVTA